LIRNKKNLFDKGTKLELNEMPPLGAEETLYVAAAGGAHH